MDLPIPNLRHFVRVAELRSYREAAESVHRSQPAISLSIRELERRLDRRLFETHDRARLTPFGETFLPRARMLLERYDRDCEGLHQLARGAVGRLAIGCVSTAIIHWVAEVTARFLQSFPGIELSLIDDNTTGVERRVLAGELDFGVCGRQSTDPRLVFQTLVRDRFGVVCRRDHPWAKRSSVAWAEIEGQPLIENVAHHHLRDWPEARPLLRPMLSVGNILSLEALLEQGVGIAVLPELSVTRRIRTLAFVPLRKPRVDRELGMLRSRDASPSPPAEAFERMLRARITQKPIAPLSAHARSSA